MPSRKNVLVYGTDSNAVGFGSAISENPNSRFNLIGFLNTENNIKGRLLDKKNLHTQSY